jgi:hypothetical protein
MTKLAAIPIDTFVFLVLVLIAGFFRWITKQADAAKGTGESAPPVPRKNISPREETDAERVRRFLEALGQPTSSTPPPRIEKHAKRASERRVVVPKERRTILAPLPPLTTVPAPLPEEVLVSVSPPARESTAMHTGVSPVIETTTVPALVPIAFPETVHESPVQAEVASLLSSGRGLRDAIILREVFGPPRSLRDSEF